MEYRKEYRNIQFRVVFSHHTHIKGKLAFAAQPYELLDGGVMSKEPSSYLVYGSIEKGGRLEIGFKDFSFEMTKGLHERLGALYEIVRKEYHNHIIKIA